MKTNYFLEFSRDKTPTVAFLILYLSLLLITGINTMTAEDPMKVVAVGTGQFVEFMSGK